MKKFLKLSLIFLFFAFFFKGQIFAADECLNPNSPPQYYSDDYICNTWIEYDCPWGTDYGNNVGKRTVNQYCTGIDADCTGEIYYNHWLMADDCDDCDYCVAGGTECASVLPPLSPLDSATSVKTPVVFDWCNIENAQSYQLRVYEIDDEGTEQYFYTKNTTMSEFCAKDLNEDKTYTWQIVDCTDQNSAVCGGFGQKWEFSTDGPAIISPPSLSSPGNGADVSIPVPIRWSSVANAKSYYINIYKDNELVDILTTTEPEATLDLCAVSKNATYEWEVAACLNDNGTRCGTTCCDNESGYSCADFSSSRTFDTMDSAAIAPPKLINPTSTDSTIPVVNLSDSLEWKRVCGAESYRYKIKEGRTTEVNEPTSSIKIGFSDLLDDLSYGTTYSWQVKSCWDETGDQCEEDWSQVWEFKTAGGTPTIIGPNNDATNVVIPVSLSWEHIAVSSYTYEICTDNLFREAQIVTSTDITLPEAFVDYPTLAQNVRYWWRVKACVDRQGDNCGDWSSVYNFTTFELGAPCVSGGSLDEGCLFPEDGGSLFTYQKNISWRAVEGAKAYKYKIDYASEEDNPPEDENDPYCDTITGQVVIQPTIVSSNSVRISLKCLGTYNWWLESCLDQNCTKISDSTPGLRFTLIQPVPPAQFGLVPCGRISDIPDTPWNERDQCEIKHVFLLIKNIIDFALWRVGLFALALLVIFTAAVSYFSLGAPGTVVNIKQIWQRAGTGYLIMFLAWIIINLITMALGFRVELLGRWWSLPF